MEAQKYYRKGFKMRENIQHLLNRDYRSEVVDRIRANGNVFEAGGLTLRIADEFGFCYGVDRAVDYAFQTREKFPDRRIYITGDMIHNPSMNARLREMGIEFLSEGFNGRPDEKFDTLGTEDVVLLPAFGAPVGWVNKLRERECIVVDTTCGSVLSVWKRVARYANKDFTSIIHGKYYHEETKATASQTLKDGGNGKYLIVRNLEETGHVVDFILGKMSAKVLREKLGHGMSPGFDPETDLKRVGVANQTTMLMSETMAVGEELRKAMVERYGEEDLAEHFQLFDTICSATQDRQDAL
ncbi:MAG TPA: 4-hydroxy-3-methylbut-2-enyl diphosphate reductase, partial [Rubrobacteraceae bacterium]|nr:4-hydroxy-3-methylbut-2-enyl diphosphate reductase [Rubrobacteraceae bacterium]